jgi:hypothetical protein
MTEAEAEAQRALQESMDLRDHGGEPPYAAE